MSEHPTPSEVIQQLASQAGETLIEYRLTNIEKRLTAVESDMMSKSAWKEKWTPYRNLFWAVAVAIATAVGNKVYDYFLGFHHGP